PELVTIMVEKQQVELLASSILEILSRVGKETAAGPPEEAMELEEFVEPMWRAGRLSIGYLEERDLLLLEVEEVLDEEEEVVGEGARHAVYKPRDGEAPLWDFPDGTLCKREVAAYVVAQALGWPSVPPTVLRDGPEGLGSAQLFVEFDTRHHFFTLQEQRADD